MYLTTRDDFLFPIESQFNKIFDQFFTNGPVKDSLKAGVGYPKMDVTEDDNELSIRVAVPGLKLDDIDVILDNSNSNPQLTISGRTVVPQSNPKAKYFVKELRASSFKRTIILPEYAKNDPEAFLEDGILTLKWRVPIGDKENEPKRITIKQIKK